MFKHIKIDPTLLGNNTSTIRKSLSAAMISGGMSYNERELVMSDLGYIFDVDWLFIVLNKYFTLVIIDTGNLN